MFQLLCAQVRSVLLRNPFLVVLASLSRFRFGSWENCGVRLSFSSVFVWGFGVNSPDL